MCSRAQTVAGRGFVESWGWLCAARATPIRPPVVNGADFPSPRSNGSVALEMSSAQPVCPDFVSNSAAEKHSAPNSYRGSDAVLPISAELLGGGAGFVNPAA